MELIGRIRIRLRQNRNRLLIESMIRSLYSGLKFIEERWIVSLVDVIEIPEIAEPNAVLRTKSSQPGRTGGIDRCKAIGKKGYCIPFDE